MAPRGMDTEALGHVRFAVSHLPIGGSMKVNKVHAAVVAALTGASGLTYQTAFAQEGLEEIVVTATRREQNLQEVPISIVAITGESLEMRGLQNVENLNATVPNLSVMGSGGGTG